MLADTDVIIDAFDGKASAGRAIADADDRLLSVVSYMELMRGAQSRRETIEIKRFLIRQGFSVLPLTEQVGHRAATYIEEYALGSGLGVADALIAATAAEHGLTLCTGNAKHYRPIAELTVQGFRP